MRQREGVILLLVGISIAVFAGMPGQAKSSDLRDFTSDGCSLFPDGDMKDRELWCVCCFEHDISYWRGGTEEERKKADEALRDCVLARTKNKVLADLMYQGVRMGGQPVFPTWYRWGYGWQYGRGYAPVTEKEQSRVDEKLEAYRREHPRGYCLEEQR